MIGFVLGVVGLLALAGCLLHPAWRARPPGAGQQVPAHLGILADRLAALDRELDAGRIDPAEHRAARDELQRRVLDESADPSVDEAAAPIEAGTGAGAQRAAWAVAIVVPLASLALYAAIGNRAGLDAGPVPPLASAGAGHPASDPEVSPDAIEALLAKLAKRLDTPSADPASDAQGWTMLARSYAGLQRFTEADRAYARAIALAPADAGLLADRADVLAMLQGERLAGEPERLVGKALELDPRNVKALALAGTAAFERRDEVAARRHWQAARALVPAGSELANGLDRSLAEVGGGQPPEQPAIVRGRVALAPALVGRVAPGDTVFIVARASQGPRMPLAVVRRTVADLPFDFQLDDSLAMQPALKLSAHDRVVVSARVSRAGDALPRSGDLQGESAEVSNRTSGLQLSIDTVRK